MSYTVGDLIRDLKELDELKKRNGKKGIKSCKRKELSGSSEVARAYRELEANGIFEEA